MAAVSLHTIMEFCSDEPKLVKRGENAVDSKHVIQMSYDADQQVLSGTVQASMKKKVMM